MLQKLSTLSEKFVLSLLRYYKYTQQIPVEIFNNDTVSQLLIIEYMRNFHDMVITIYPDHYKIYLCDVLVHNSVISTLGYDSLRMSSIEVGLQILIEADDV